MMQNIDKGRKEVKGMAVLATPKKNSYIVKEVRAKRIVSSRTSQRKKAAIQKNAASFRKNNLRAEK